MERQKIWLRSIDATDFQVCGAVSGHPHRQVDSAPRDERRFHGANTVSYVTQTRKSLICATAALFLTLSFSAMAQTGAAPAASPGSTQAPTTTSPTPATRRRLIALTRQPHRPTVDRCLLPPSHST